MIEFTRIVCGLAAAFTLSAASVAQDEYGGTRYPELIEVPVGDEGVTHFVVGQYGWGEMLAEMGNLRAESADRDREIATQLYEARDTIPAGMLFEAARRYASFDEEQAVYVFFLARARTFYDALRCVDSTAMNAIEIITDMSGQEVAALLNITTDGNTVARTERMQRALERVLSSGEIATGQFSPWWICSGSDSAYFAAVNGAEMPEGEWLKNRSLWPGIEEQVRRNIRENQALLAITLGTRELGSQPQ
ncbi:hypothetical protein V0U79_12345 [Hyphobacterium sp. HN65]|uniref:DUF4919 domain-containing protein n=1 Tax=Hyphobacterium lacteum TaxID=3116575 RepID=A0ABU7LV05_9PROT|nr:hypothetical protein [Hyphobacterium sp. HN65]MEE2527159.1 hypothetical protein [Hyphobacterium sp. HN65]